MSVQYRYYLEYRWQPRKNVYYYSYQVSLCSVGSTMHSSITGTRVAVKKWLPHRGNELVFMIRRLNTCSRTWFISNESLQNVTKLRCILIEKRLAIAMISS
jgi:hypothetical protein